MRRTLSLLFVLGWSASGVACDQLAGAQPAPAPPARPQLRRDDPLLEGETCTRTEDCPRTARCLDGRCQPAARSFEGEVLVERGLRALATNRFAEGAESFRNADRAFRARSSPVPAAVSCGLARALTGLVDRGGAAPDARESAARALAACLAAAPRGSAMADQALAGLAALTDRGLDVAALDRPDAALMTGRDPRPTAENTRVTVVFTGTADGSRGPFRELVTGDAVKAELTRCFLEWWQPSRPQSDHGTIRVNYSRAVDDWEELGAPRFAVLPADIAPVTTDAGASAQHWTQCAAAAIQSAATALRWPARADRWAESVVVTVAPGA